MDAKDQKIMELETEIEALEEFTGLKKSYHPNYPYKGMGIDGYWYLYKKHSRFLTNTLCKRLIGESTIISEHRYLIQQKTGQQIPKGYVVHHKDRNRCNNALSNLELLTLSEHGKAHYQMREVCTKKCKWCGGEFGTRVTNQLFCKPSHRKLWTLQRGKK